MVRPPSFDINGVKSGAWSKEEDDALRAFVAKHGHRNWQKLPSLAGLARSGKSCRLRWVNYLQPGLKKGNFSKEEVELIIKLHNKHGNKWSVIAESFPGRTDNDIKNHWHAHIKKRSRFVSRAEMGHEEQSFEMNYCKESSNDEEETPSFNGQDSSAENTSINFEAYDHNRSFNTEEEFNDVGSLYYDTPTNFSDSSDGGGGITYNEFNIHDLPPLLSEEELSTLGLCYNHTPCTFSDSSDGGGISYDDHMTLNIHLSPFIILQEELSTLGLFYNDTPTFSDSSDGGGITYDHNTHYLPPFPQQYYSDFGLCNNHTPTFYDSSDGVIPSDSILKNGGEVSGFNHLERAWYFGDDNDDL